jgi:TetR/AcrR family transcriptional regulator, transcriptional repressor for nem operon
MSQTPEAARTRKLTARGAATKERITQAAARLIYAQGVNPTTLDDVRTATGVSKSQLYNHFPDKTALVHEVIALQSRTVLAREEERLRRLSSLQGLQRWRDALVQANSLQDGSYGCALGSMAMELSDQDEWSRQALLQTFTAWEQLLIDGLRRLQQNDTLRADADPVRLAIGLMAALQGGYLLARAARNSEPMGVALDMALDHIRTYST